MKNEKLLKIFPLKIRLVKSDPMSAMSENVCSQGRIQGG